LLRFFISNIIKTAYFALLLGFSLNANAKKLRILAYGDSLTAGYRLSSTQAYPAQLEALLKKRGFEVEIVNAGVSGDTSADALKRLDWSLSRGPYDWVLLCIGANDGLRSLPVAAMKRNISEILEKLKSKGAKVLLVGMKMPTNLSPVYRREFEETYKNLAQQHKVSFYGFLLDGVATNASLNLMDQIHPNENGYKVISERLADFLMKDKKFTSSLNR